jgi:hypothetical protein
MTSYQLIGTGVSACKKNPKEPLYVHSNKYEKFYQLLIKHFL